MKSDEFDKLHNYVVHSVIFINIFIKSSGLRSTYVAEVVSVVVVTAAIVLVRNVM